VIVNDLDVMCVTLLPSEDDPPLVIDPDAVFATTLSFERLKSVPGRRSEVTQFVGRVEKIELPEST
jgi:hypothetical protein